MKIEASLVQELELPIYSLKIIPTSNHEEQLVEDYFNTDKIGIETPLINQAIESKIKELNKGDWDYEQPMERNYQNRLVILKFKNRPVEFLG